MVDHLEVSIALALGELTRDDAIRFGEKLLEAGDEDESIVSLASMYSQPYISESDYKSNLRDVLRHLNIRELERHEALRQRCITIADRITTGQIDPIDGANTILTEVWSYEHIDQARAFISLLDDYEDTDSDSEKSEIYNSIKSAASSLKEQFDDG